MRLRRLGDLTPPTTTDSPTTASIPAVQASGVSARPLRRPREPVLKHLRLCRGAHGARVPRRRQPRLRAAPRTGRAQRAAPDRSIRFGRFDCQPSRARPGRSPSTQRTWTCRHTLGGKRTQSCQANAGPMAVHGAVRQAWPSGPSQTSERRSVARIDRCLRLFIGSSRSTRRNRSAAAVRSDNDRSLRRTSMPPGDSATSPCSARAKRCASL